jgi:Ser/Thr protein kinase RdoA (MazF antagonist)
MSTGTEVGAVGSKLTNQDLAIEALGFFVDNPKEVPMEATSGGVNNIVQYVTLPTGKKLLRIYNNGLDSPRVKVEHAILEQLNKDYADQLDFKVPNFIKSKSGPSFVKLSNGAEACMCDFIEGELPKLTCVEAIGKSSGELCTAMSKLKDIDLTGSSDPYWDMWKVHHFGGRTREEAEKAFVAEMEGSNFDGALRPFAKEMLEETMAVTRKCENEYKSFPEQLIHADIHYDNVLVKDSKVSAILDFEFAAYDWRAMELAVCLSKYAGEPNALDIFDEFAKGYAQTAQLTKPELLAMPDLINLRVLSNVVYFVGRAITNEDNISSLTKRIENYTTRVRWIKDHEKEIQDILVKRFGV